MIRARSFRSVSFFARSTFSTRFGMERFPSWHGTERFSCMFLLPGQYIDRCIGQYISISPIRPIYQPISAGILADISADISDGILADISADVLADISASISGDTSAGISANISASISANVSADIRCYLFRGRHNIFFELKMVCNLARDKTPLRIHQNRISQGAPLQNLWLNPQENLRRGSTTICQ